MYKAKPDFNGHECEEILAGKIKNPDDFEKFKEKAYQAGVYVYMNDPDIPNPKELLRSKSRNTIIATGVREFRRILKEKGVLAGEMDRLRKKQVNPNPFEPRQLFARTLLADLSKSLSDIVDGKNYGLHFYSAAKDEKLDYAAGIDCWVELVDLRNNKCLFYYTIDLTSNPEKFKDNSQYLGIHKDIPLSNTVYFYDPFKIYMDENGRETVDRSLFYDREYKLLKDETVEAFAPIIARVRSRICELSQ